MSEQYGGQTLPLESTVGMDWSNAAWLQAKSSPRHPKYRKFNCEDLLGAF